MDCIISNAASCHHTSIRGGCNSQSNMSNIDIHGLMDVQAAPQAAARTATKARSSKRQPATEVFLWHLQ